MKDEPTQTVPIHEPSFPVRQLAVEVVHGPDAGTRAAVTSDAIRVGTAEGNDLRLTDPTVSRYHLELRRDHDRVEVIDHGSTNGTQASDARIERHKITVGRGASIHVGNTVVTVRDGDVHMVRPGPRSLGELRGSSMVMSQLFASATTVAASDANVLLLGESGTGKELLAHAIHEASPRAERPFETVDCGALTPNLFLSELFGHEAGAFTGADRAHVGAFERAHGGTLFLDEVGELPAQHQVALLGALERRRIRRVGGVSEIPVDVRLVSATHRDLHAAVNEERFRLDLFYRLCVVTLRVPALRERPGDVPELLEHFLREDHGIEDVDAYFPHAERMRLAARDWPGNVRELRNYVLGLVVLGRPPDGPTPSADGGLDAFFDRLMSLPYAEAKEQLGAEFERRYLELALERAGGNMRQAARDSRMNRSHLMKLLRRHGFR